jgi:uncharacterized membrane protein (DUF2068 family)
MEETSHPPQVPPAPAIEPLRWIGAYKLLKALLSLLGALMVLRLMHRNLPEVAEHWMARLHIVPHSLLGKVILHRIVLIKNRNLGWVVVALLAYVPLAVAEGIGLMLRKVWAEWLAMITTGAMIPLEIIEVCRRTTWLRVVILIANIAVLIYLIVRLKRERPKHATPSRLPITPPASGSAHFSQNTDLPPRVPQSDVPG